MSIPTIRTTPAELATEKFWHEQIDPAARNVGIELPTQLEVDSEDRHAHVLRAADGTPLLIVRTDREPLCCPYHDRYSGSGGVTCEQARFNPGVLGHPEVYGYELLDKAPQRIKDWHGYKGPEETS